MKPKGISVNRLVHHGLAALIALAGVRAAAADRQYLAFQIFEGGPDPAIPFDYVMIYTPKEKIAAVAHDIVATIGVTGGERAKLALNLGPISFDHTDAEARQIIDDGFAIALAENVAVGFHIDDAMFWSNRADLIGDPANVEWTDFSGTLSTGLLLDWAHPPARMCYNAPKIQAEVTRRARDVIGAEIVSQLAVLRAQGKENLFAGVIAGWESHMGQDAITKSPVGFHALANRGFGPGHPPANLGAEVASIVADFIGLWTSGLAQAGIDPTRIYTHVSFMTKAQFATLTVPPDLTYELLVNRLPSSQQPSVAFATNARPGFSTYPGTGLFDQIQEERALHGEPAWASCEGANLIPPGPAGNSNITMETYLARCFNHGATLVNILSWGIGGPSVKDTNPFRIVTEGPEALATYRKFLSGQNLVEPTVTAVDYESWKRRYFTTAQQANPAISGPSANPSGDGMSNLLKYAFGLNPGAQDFTHGPAGTTQNFSGSNYLQISYRKQQSTIDLSYAIQVSNDLVIWNSGTSYLVFVSQSDNGDGTDQVIVRDLSPTSNQPRRFMRLLVAQP